MGATRCFLLFVSTLLLTETAAIGQAWVPPKGEGEIAISYQNLFTRDHFNSDGTRHDYGHIRLYDIVQEIDFGVTNKLAVNVTIPYGIGKYNGPYPHQLPIDNGDYHGALQDFHVGFRYNVVKRPLQFTPFVSIAFPSHGYTHFAHSAVGIDMWELQTGMTMGRSLAPVLPRGYFQWRYGYSFMQRVLGIRPNRSRMEGQLGYFVTRRLSVQGLGVAQVTHSGLNFPQDFPVRTPGNATWAHHDQILAINFLNMGAGIGYGITRGWQIYSSLLTSVWGQNGHAIHTGFSAGMSWTFRTPWARPRIEAALPDESPDLRTAKLTPPTQAPCH